jgi:cytochrome c
MALGTFPSTDGAGPVFGRGTPATREELRAWDVDILPDGSGLPPGRGTAAEGEAIYSTLCAGCHGAEGEGASALPLVGGARKAVGYRVGRAPTAESRPTWLQFYPYATTLFDYVRNAMPWNAPGSLTDGATYSLVAWMLWRNGIIARDTAMDRDSLPRIEMPAHAHFAYPSGAALPR